MRNKKIIKVSALVVLISFLNSIFMPTVTYALTSGPASPEFSSFEPVATTDMVDVFSGDFTYNLPVVEIPGSDGGGYALSLSYHSGGGCEEEASWVGYGWTLNPGAINRNVRGFPDDYDNDAVDYYNKARPNWTIATRHKASMEFFSKEKISDTKNPGNSTYKPSTLSPTLSFGTSLRYNNYQGFARSYSLGASFGGMVSVGMEVGASGITFSADINPAKILNKFVIQNKIDKKVKEIKDKYCPEDKMTDEDVAALDKLSDRSKQASNLANNASGYGLSTFSMEPGALNVPEFRGYNLNISFDFSARPSQVPIGFNVGTSGTFSMQSNIPKSTVGAYGYAHNTSSIGNHMSDYYIERNQPFDKQDLILGIPFSNPDNFMLTGEGLSGGFRMHNRGVGHFHPNATENKMKIFNIGCQLAGVVNLGVGLTFGFGVQNTKMEDWKKTGNMNDFLFENSDPVWRFSSDMGGALNYGSNDIDGLVKVYKSPDFPGISSGKVSIDNTDVYDSPIASSSAGRSSFIQDVYNGDKLHGFVITNEEGSTYRYGGRANESNYTLYSKNETNLSVNVTGNPINNYVVEQNLSLNNGYDLDICDAHTTAIGDVKKEPFANTYLINEITSYDYVDRTPVGADDDDLGGWTKFEYDKIYGGSNPWYRWRAPYKGLIYQKNDFSDKKDDLASVTTGEKEIAYLKTIRTKTHTAYFVTNKSVPSDFPGITVQQGTYLQGSNDNRKDGLAAANLTTEDPAALGAVNTTDRLRYLEKVVLFANDRPDKPIKTVYFKYDYHLVPNLPNNTNSAWGEKGKLTLTHVWSEYEGTAGAFVSPYEFKYRYKPKAEFNNPQQTLTDEMPQLADFFDLNFKYSDFAQNPDYKPYLLDGWGNNQARAEQRHNDMNPWLYQGNFSTNENFDPAAWQLKQIKLPSGGEILIEYEQKNYQYVQDRRAMAMVSLTYKEDFSGIALMDHPIYDINLDDLGVDASQVGDYVNQLHKYFVSDKNKIYFKFLFALKDNNPSLTDCKSEYIDGYVNVSSVAANGPNSIRIILDGSGSGYDGGYTMTPRQGAYDFYSTQRVGKYHNDCMGSNYEITYDGPLAALAERDHCNSEWTTGLLQIIEKFAFATTAIINMEINSLWDLSIQPPLKAFVGNAMNNRLSYFKLPIPEKKAKRGGGIRVKRLLMFDPGIQDGDAAIYGSEYKYELEDGTSSGVATTEPSSMHDENALVDFLPKKTQSWLNRHIVGADKEQSEGPIGESLLPGASVGHSRVVIQNIHTGKTGTGYSVNQFYTVKDYPFDKDYDYTTQAADPDRHFDFAVAPSGSSGGEKGISYSNLADQTKRDFMNLPTGFFNYSHKRLWAAQAFRFIINEMHGKTKSVEQFQGDYMNSIQIANSNSVPILSSSTRYSYYEPGESVRVLDGDESLPTRNGNAVWKNPGKEMEITMESKNVHDNSMDFELSVDLDVGLSFWPPIFVTFNPSIVLSDKTISTHATSKVIRYPAIVKSMQNFKDGIWARTENIGFDNATGKPILTRATDSYHNIPVSSSNPQLVDGSYYNLKVPAHWYYSQMDQKSINASNTNQLNAMAGAITTYGGGANPINGATNTWLIPDTKVINATANTYNATGNWTDQAVLDDYSLPSVSQLSGFWRPEASYVYKTDIVPSSDPSNKIYNGGTYTAFSYFPYTSPPSFNTPPWIKLTEVKKYSPHGNALEEVNNLGIYTAAKYGYNFTQPVMIAKNARYFDIVFNDFEENGGSSAFAHSGVKSEELLNGGSFQPFSPIQPETSSGLSSKGAILKLWSKADENLSTTLSVAVNGGPSIYPEKIAQTGEWTLYSFKIDEIYFPVGTPANVELHNASTSPIYIDDVRIQPTDAQATCYVYDIGSLRLLAQFDDQHFGLFYQYNGEGKLVRKLIETERGIKTIQETQYNQPVSPRIQ